MSAQQPPAEDYETIMGGLVEWLTDVYEDRLSQAKEALASAETILGGIGYEERSEQLLRDAGEHPTPQRSLAWLASWFGEIERELETRRSQILRQHWESMAGEYALVSVQNLTEARQYLGLAQSAAAHLLVSLAGNRLNAWEKQTRLYGIRLYLERLETTIIWAIESATNGLRQHQQDSGAKRQPSITPPPAPPQVSTATLSYRPTPPAGALAPAGQAPASEDHAPSELTPASQSPHPDPSPAEPQTAAPEKAGGLFKRLRWRKRPQAK